MIPSWYDVLGVEQDATADEIRAAWKESVLDLDPTDRRFRQRSRAAEVLLDPTRRAAHDADLAAAEDPEDPDETDETAVADETDVTDDADGSDVDDDDMDDDMDDGVDAADDDAAVTTAPRRPSPALTAALGVVAVLVAIAAAWSLVGGGGAPARAGSTAPSSGSGELPDARRVEAARAAAEAAIAPVLSYDYRSLEQSREAAMAYLTPEYAEEYARFFDGAIEENAGARQAVVTTEVLSSGIVRTGVDRVDVLVLVDRPTRNATRDDVSQDQVTMQMRDVGGDWLVDCMITVPGSSCRSE